MKLPQPLIESLLFQLFSLDDLFAALQGTVDENEQTRARDLFARGLPPIISVNSLSVMIGINSGIIWSFINRTHKHYSVFPIKKGKGTRQIESPRVALKVILKWLSHHLQRKYDPPEHVFGFVSKRSHIDAVLVHRDAQWAYGVDIENFFSTTPRSLIVNVFKKLGYADDIAIILSKLSCFADRLAQGAPTSPALSNFAFSEMDIRILELAKKYSCKVTRYADDIVFSGLGGFPESMRDDVTKIFSESCWKLAPHKEELQPLKGRIKIHGLLVSDGTVRLTKGYRNKLRAYKHILKTRGYQVENNRKLLGHIQYGMLVTNKSGMALNVVHKDSD